MAGPRNAKLPGPLPPSPCSNSTGSGWADDGRHDESLNPELGVVADAPAGAVSRSVPLVSTASVALARVRMKIPPTSGGCALRHIRTGNPVDNKISCSRKVDL